MAKCAQYVLQKWAGIKAYKNCLKNGYLTTSCLLSHHGRGAYLIANKQFFLQYPSTHPYIHVERHDIV